MNHSLSRKGYVFLYLFLYIAVSMGINFVVFLLNNFGAAVPLEVYAAIKAVLMIALALICANRFLAIEGRAPTTGENYFISGFAFLAVFILMLLKTGLVVGGATQNKEIDIASFANEMLLSLVILSAICYFALFLSFGIITKIRSNSHSYS